MTRLLFLGTVHRDPAGKRRLLSLLRQIRPAAISLEVSPASIELRQRWGRYWNRIFRKRLAELGRGTGLTPGELMARPGIRGVYEYLRLPFEYRAALAYARDESCPVFLLDDPRLAASYLNRVTTELLSADNMNLLAKADHPVSLAEETESEYRRANHYINENGPHPEPRVSDREAWEARETKTAQKLRLLHEGLSRRAGARLSGRELLRGLIIAPEAVAFQPETALIRREAVHLYVGGWEHLVEDESGSRLYSRLKDLNPERRLCHVPQPEPGS